MRRIGTIIIILIALSLLGLGYIYWRHHAWLHNRPAINKEEEAADFKKAEDLLHHSQPEEALNIISKYSGEIESNNEEGKKWLDLLIAASEQTFDVSQLIILYPYYPQAFQKHEKASLIVANNLLATGKGKDYKALRNLWKGHEQNLNAWFLLDADNLLLEGKQKEAKQWLLSKSFEGKDDTGRLIRLALLSVAESPKDAWDYLSQAYSKDPKNPEIRTYRAKLLEAIGKNSLALSEYTAAAQIAPKNLFLQDQLAEFYLRHKDYVDALQVWESFLNPPSADFIWEKTLFWNKVIKPIKYDWTKTKPPKGTLQPYIEYLLSLKPGVFWDKVAFDKLPDASSYLKNQQSTFWLRLLELFKKGNEKEAWNLLQYNPFEKLSWDPDLEAALKRILAFRKSKTFIFDQSSIASKNINSELSFKTEARTIESPLFTQLENLSKADHLEKEKKPIKVPADLEALLLSQEVFSAAFLSAGWMEAAIQLHAINFIPDNFPDWVAYGYTQALRMNEGNLKALEFATLQRPTPKISLLIGEILLSEGNLNAGMEQLSKMSKENSDIGFRAAWLLSLSYIEKKEYDKAKTTIEEQPRLAQDVLGKETLARIALLEGKEDLADQLYSKIEDKSAEAKSYLARRAFQEKNWKKARELTETLLKEFPNNPLLHENLKKITEQQKQNTEQR